MQTQTIIYIVVALFVLLLIIIFLSIVLKKNKRNKIYAEETTIYDDNQELYKLLVVELERTEKISKNDESISLYNTWIDEFEKITIKKETTDKLYKELTTFYNDKDHKNFLISASELEGKRFKFNDELRSLYNKVKQYTEYELDNTRISLQLKTEIKEITTIFQQNLEMLEIFNKSFYEEVASTQGLIAEFESLQRNGDYPEGRNILKNCNRKKNKIKYTLDVILEFYDYLTDLDADIINMENISNEIKKIGFSINILDFDSKISNFFKNKDEILSIVVDISFANELTDEFVNSIENSINTLESEINELKDILEEKFTFIKEIIEVIDKNEELVRLVDNLLESAQKEKVQIINLYELEDIKQLKQIDEYQENFIKFKSDYSKLLEMTFNAKEDYSSLKTRIIQSNKFLTHTIKNIKTTVYELKSIRNDEIMAIQRLDTYKIAIIHIDLYLRKHKHKFKTSNDIKTSLEEVENKIQKLEFELSKEPLNIDVVRKLNSSITKLLLEITKKNLDSDIKRRKGALLLMNYCSRYNASDELNLTLKRMHREYYKFEYIKVLKDAKELLEIMNENGSAIYDNIVSNVENSKFENIFGQTIIKIEGDK